MSTCHGVWPIPDHRIVSTRCCASRPSSAGTVARLFVDFPCKYPPPSSLVPQKSLSKGSTINNDHRGQIAASSWSSYFFPGVTRLFVLLVTCTRDHSGLMGFCKWIVLDHAISQWLASAGRFKELRLPSPLFPCFISLSLWINEINRCNATIAKCWEIFHICVRSVLQSSLEQSADD